jgi:hypothetical protein
MRRPIPSTPTVPAASEARTHLDLTTEEAITQEEELIAQIETLHAKELELEITLERSLAEGAKWKACAMVAKAKAKAIALVDNLNVSAEVDIFQKALGLVGRGTFTVVQYVSKIPRKFPVQMGRTRLADGFETVRKLFFSDRWL